MSWVPPLAAAGDTTVFLAFTAGFISFVSPCVLPLVPGYLSAISGIAITDPEATREGGRSQVVWPAVLFCLSFTVFFVALGMAATGVGATLNDHRATLNKIAGAMLVAMGLLFVLTPLVPALNREFRPETLLAKAGSGGPIVAGFAFAVAWTPCVGPTLGTILTAAATREEVGQGGLLLAVYSLGLAVPFVLCAVAFERATTAFRWVRDRYRVITAVAGVVLIGVGALVFAGELTDLNREAQRVLPEWLDFVYEV